MTSNSGSPEILIELRQLELDLEQDLMHCTTRDSHIRLSTRLHSLRSISRKLDQTRDTSASSDTVVS